MMVNTGAMPLYSVTDIMLVIHVASAMERANLGVLIEVLRLLVPSSSFLSLLLLYDQLLVVIMVMMVVVVLFPLRALQATMLQI